MRLFARWHRIPSATALAVLNDSKREKAMRFGRYEVLFALLTLLVLPGTPAFGYDVQALPATDDRRWSQEIESFTVARLRHDLSECVDILLYLASSASSPMQHAQIQLLWAELKLAELDWDAALHHLELSDSALRDLDEQTFRDLLTLRRSQALLGKHHYDEVRELLDQITTRIQEGKNQALILELAWVQAYLHQAQYELNRSMEWVDIGLSISQPGRASAARRAELLRLHAINIWHLSGYPEAATAFDAASRVAEELQYYALQCSINQAHGNCLLVLERYDEALSLYLKTVEVAERQELPSLIVTPSYIMAGTALTSLGKYSDALARFNQAEISLSSESTAGLRIALNSNLASIYLGLGMPDQALINATRAGELGALHNDIQTPLVSLGNAGIAYMQLGEYEQAASSFQSALSTYKSSGETRSEILCGLLNSLGNVHSVQGDFARAADLASEALKVAIGSERSHSAIDSQIIIARCSSALRDPIWREQLNEVLPRAIAVGSDRQQMETYDAFASCKMRAGELAVDELNSALNIALSFGRQFTWESGYKSGLIFEANRLGAALAQSYLNESNIDRAFTVVQTVKGVSLLQLLAQAKVQSQNPEVQEKLDEYRSINARLLTLRKSLLATDVSQHNGINTEITSLQAQANLCWKFMEECEPLLAQIVDVHGLEPAQASLLLRPGQVLVEYFVADYFDKTLPLESRPLPLELLIFTLSHAGELQAHRVELRREDGSVFADAEELDVWLLDQVEKLYQGDQTAREALNTLLIDPISAQLGTFEDVLICPDRNLHMVPFELLGIDPKILLDTHQVQYSTSATMLSYHRSPPGRSEAALVAGITFGAAVRWSEAQAALLDLEEKSDAAPTLLSAEDVLDYLYSQPLYGVLHSSNEVAQLLRTEPMLDEAATEQALRAAMPKKRVIHLATHGLLTDSPLLNGIVTYVSPNDRARAKERLDDPQHDGILTMAEVMGLPLQGTELTVLQCCHGADGEISPGAGVMGLAQGFTYAGSDYVLASLRAVPDDATADLMVAFYRHWVEDGMELQRALQLAKQDIRDVGVSAAAWAPFVLYGASH